MQSKNIVTVLWVLAGLGLILTVLPSILVFTGSITFDLHLTLMTIGMVLWFGARVMIQSIENTKEIEPRKALLFGQMQRRGVWDTDDFNIRSREKFYPFVIIF